MKPAWLGKINAHTETNYFYLIISSLKNYKHMDGH